MSINGRSTIQHEFSEILTLIFAHNDDIKLAHVIRCNSNLIALSRIKSWRRAMRYPSVLRLTCLKPRAVQVTMTKPHRSDVTSPVSNVITQRLRLLVYVVASITLSSPSRPVGSSPV